jgi:2-succinyl-6-hydroxy-2,4-cyclohexadiene-1-carboxylate synthase
MGEGSDWADVAQSLAKTHRCICLDLPGHGQNWTKLDQTGSLMDEIARALLIRLNTLGVDAFDLVGYSMGGRLAFYVALICPQRVKRLIIESASPGLKSEEARQQRKNTDKDLARKLERVNGNLLEFFNFLQAWYDQPFFRNLHKDTEKMDRMLERRMNNKPEQLAAMLRGMGTGVQPNLWEKLPDIQVPTLLITGEEDRKFCFIAEAMSDLSENIAVEELAGCGHNTHVENTDAFCTVLKYFLTKQ